MIIEIYVEEDNLSLWIKLNQIVKYKFTVV